MPTNDEVRSRVERSVRDIDPDVGIALERVARRGRRRKLVSATVGAVAIASVVVLAIVAVPRILDVSRTPDRPAQSPSTAGSSDLAGAYRTTIEPAPGVVTRQHMEGPWGMQLDTDGSLALSGPPSFRGDTSGVSFRVVGGEFQTIAFANDLCKEPQAGTYRWERSGGRLRFSVVDDPCEVRVALFAGQAWSQQPS